MIDRIVSFSLSAVVFTVAVCAARTAYAETPPSVAQSHVLLTAMPLPGAGSVCGSASFQDKALFRVYPSGKTGAKPFAVPRGMKLVVTDVEWSAMYNPESLPFNVGYSLRLIIGLDDKAGHGAEVFASRTLHLDENNLHGRPGSSEQLSTGFVVGGGAVICPHVTILADGNQDGGAEAGAVGLERLILRGYLAP